MTETSDVMKIPPEAERFRPMCVVLGRAPGDNAWQGRVEGSFSMGWSQDRVRLWWSGTARSILGTLEINGREDAEGNCPPRGGTKQHGWEYAVFDLEDPSCPIVVAWEEWLADMAQGVRRKYENRNPRFRMRDDA